MFNFFGSYDKNQIKNHKNQFIWNLFNRKKTKKKRKERKGNFGFTIDALRLRSGLRILPCRYF